MIGQQRAFEIISDMQNAKRVEEIKTPHFGPTAYECEQQLTRIKRMNDLYDLHAKVKWNPIILPAEKNFALRIINTELEILELLCYGKQSYR